MKLSFSLSKPKQAPAEPPSLKRPAAFALGEDEPIDAAPTSAAAERTAPANKQLLAQNVETSKAMKKRMEAEMKVDATVYEYDEVWDRMQEAKLRQKEAKERDALERKPKYIHGLLASAATRKLDHLRAEEKMMQLEREAEGDQFKDKEVFVTQTYKEQMEQVRKAEEEEKKREELRKKQGATSTGMTHFYRKLLEESEQNHEATVAATQKPRIIGPQGPMPNLTITKPVDHTPLSDLELARIAREEGKEVELNDDNQIVDKRELLFAGLNLAAPNTRRLGLRPAAAQSSTAGAETVKTHTAVGTAASRKEINERRAREIRQQMKLEEERLAMDQRMAEEEAVRRTVAKRNTEADVRSARERYLQRKRQRLEEANQEPIPSQPG
ncbi:putative coiled-coil domain-containing protein 55 (DUF2040) [Lyophyllum shimeji]|uniref:Coiled-coil domain-containing protein 55 (DUF2040) n=1 Tax=Lyophyllum shimeji TaxID=47721 RepID=A0A9P3PFA9_LYOSH|nr:putative coiled-coil domain-containing protein 55 (DUF2040) [Lyophyllum shimeji]